MKLNKDIPGEKRRAGTRRRILKWTGNLCLFILTLASMGYLYWVYVDDRFLTVIEDNVFRSAQMPPEELLEFVDRHRIRTVIDFRSATELIEAENLALTENGVRAINIPSELVPSDEAVNSFLDVMGDVSNYPILFHCEHGIGRSSLFEAIYRIEYLGWSNEEARKSALVRSVLGSFEEDDVRGEYILNYKPSDRLSLKAKLAATYMGGTH